MNSQRNGSNLKIQIRMTLSALGRDTNINLNGLTMKELENLNRSLFAELKSKK